MVDGVYLQLRDGMVNEYIQAPLNTSLKGWNAKWFYIRNAEPSLSTDIDHLAVSKHKLVSKTDQFEDDRGR